MAMGTRKQQRQDELWIATGVPPGVYFRMLMVGYFEGIDSERGIAWRCADSLSLREFLGYALSERTPDHSMLSVVRGRIDLETHQEVFCGVLARRGEAGLLKGKTIGRTPSETMENLDEVNDDEHHYEMREVVTDKGYHSNAVLCDLAEMELRSYASEPDRGRRNWKGKSAERDAVHANRRRIRGNRGKRLLRKRGELVERPFAHFYETGRMRRVHLRGRERILKRLLIHVGACNLPLLMRRLSGVGTPRGLQSTPRGLQGLAAPILDVLLRLCRRLRLAMAWPGLYNLANAMLQSWPKRTAAIA